MPYLLATLHSSQSNRGGIGIIDPAYGLIYLQLDDDGQILITPQLKEIAYHDNNYFITTPATIQIYKLNLDNHFPIFIHHKTISRPEWLLGGKKQSDLFGIHISAKRNRLYVANNLINAVEEFTLEGNFIKRFHLFDIAPQIFKIPKAVDTYFKYGHIRRIFESDNGSIFLTISSINGSAGGCVLNFDSGEVFLNNLEKPHGGMFYKDKFFIQEVRKGLLSVYSINSNGTPTLNKHWDRKPAIFDSNYQDGVQHLRGIACLHGTVYSGVCNFGSETKDQIPPRIVSFNVESGKQDRKEIFFPDLDYFKNPRVFALNVLPEDFNISQKEKSIVFRKGTKTEIKLSSPPPLPCIKPRAKQPVPLIHCTKTTAPEIQNHTPPSSIDTISVELKNVWLSYRRNAFSLFSFKNQLRKSKEFIAIKDISFSIFEGETVGIIGRNGSGKSTLSMLISGSLSPDRGSLTTTGRVQLLSIGLGFRNELTGRENVFLNGALLGLSKSEINEYFDDIVDFSELNDFINEPVRTYSAGMRSRLGFAVATAVSPDVLILDEVLSTGDAAFRKKANERMLAMRKRTKTIIMISHSIGQIKQTCSRVIWLNEGIVMADGAANQVVTEYTAFCEDPNAWIEKSALVESE